MRRGRANTVDSVPADRVEVPDPASWFWKPAQAEMPKVRCCAQQRSMYEGVVLNSRSLHPTKPFNLSTPSIMAIAVSPQAGLSRMVKRTVGF
jgi:hypothetical protein